jgi:glucan phosphoethanolaminetransferase (alkaline phosphatase superfamily)
VTPAAENSDKAAHDEKSLGRRAATIAIWLAIVVVLALIGSAVLPRWWSHRIGSQVSGSITSGIALGLFYGFVFTFLPLALLWFVFRKRRTLKIALVLIGLAIVLAAPNLMTLGIVLGGGHAAHAGQRTLDVEAPDFRASSLIGALVAVAALGGIAYLLASRRHAHEREAKLRDELHPPQL